MLIFFVISCLSKCSSTFYVLRFFHEQNCEKYNFKKQFLNNFKLHSLLKRVDWVLYKSNNVL